MGGSYSREEVKHGGERGEIARGTRGRERRLLEGRGRERGDC